MANAKIDSNDSSLERKSICRKFPSQFFLEIRVEQDLEVESLGIGCSVSNSACGGGSGGGGGWQAEKNNKNNSVQL